MPAHDDGVAVRVLDLAKEFRRAGGDKVSAVDGVSLEVSSGEMIVVLGPSGCGKTTLLRCIAGLETPSGGEIWSGDQLLSSGDKGIIRPPEKRNFGMIFQTYAIWPHMSVFKNVAYPLAARRVPGDVIAGRVREALATVGIADLENEYPSDLSGGQQQRIAFARCLVADPEVILFDEPLSNVDAKVREELRIELRTMQQRIGFAGIYVTHDQEEAMAIADRIMVMRKGSSQQIGPPEEIYGKPRNRFTANFIGVANEWPGKAIGADNRTGMCTFSTGIGEITVAADNIATDFAPGDDVIVTSRPESVVVTRDEPAESNDNAWEGELQTVMFRGAYFEYIVDVGGVSFRARGPNLGANRHTGRVHVQIAPDKLWVVKAEQAEGNGDEPSRSAEPDRSRLS